MAFLCPHNVRKPLGLLLQDADECANHGRILAETRDGLLAHFDARQLLDLIFTIGMYTTLAFMLKTLEVPLDKRSASFASERLGGARDAP